MESCLFHIWEWFFLLLNFLIMSHTVKQYRWGRASWTQFKFVMWHRSIKVIELRKLEPYCTFISPDDAHQSLSKKSEGDYIPNWMKKRKWIRKWPYAAHRAPPIKLTNFWMIPMWPASSSEEDPYALSKKFPVVPNESLGSVQIVLK